MEEAEKDDNDKVSMYEIIRAGVDGKIATPGWYKNVKEMDYTGLLREEAYTSASQLKIMHEILKQEVNNVELTSLSVINELNKNKEDMGL
ncbi:MAG: hypothetical protein KZQ74_13710 [gamma proteobacterium symbiont of Bathyaustriella thionipta]|nr:hypothetical protein [gamma proteobacterium symbiont of Bathyaustriella thionipta]MCU7957929.1 hypothetical protein [gamma proteobacterium symbiont of Bathyaustriella thionipta]MCU7968227.1 hypothetical protein [gamma proteobacterium symbiont of Bathyaustriella thionipta]